MASPNYDWWLGSGLLISGQQEAVNSLEAVDCGIYQARKLGTGSGKEGNKGAYRAGD